MGAQRKDSTASACPETITTNTTAAVVVKRTEKRMKDAHIC